MVGAAVMLSACVSAPINDERLAESDASLIEHNNEQIKLAKHDGLNEDLNLPKQELTADTLEQLLTFNFASLSGQLPLAARSALSAAQATQDVRLARLATLFSLQTSDYDKASAASAIWLALKPDSIEANNMHIIALVGAGKIEQAKQAISAQMQGQPIDEYVKQLAALLVRQKNAEAGFEIIDYVVQLHPESAQVHVSAAYVAEVFDKYEAAEFWVNKALELKPGWDLAAQMNIRLLENQKKMAQRSAFIAEFVRQYPRSVAMRIRHASELSTLEEYQAAYDLMLAVLKDVPKKDVSKNVSALQFTAALAQQLDEPKKAAYYYRRALKLEPTNDDVRWSAAQLAATEKEHKVAERLFGDIREDDKVFDAQIQLAFTRFEIGGIDAALSVLNLIQAKTNAEYLEMSIVRHYLLMRVFNYEKAFGYVNDALVNLPDNTDLLYARALVAAELKKLTIVEQDLRAVITAEPNNADALNALGYTLADQTDRLEEAKKLIAKALLLQPDAAHILDSWGWVSYRLKDYVAAIDYLQRAYKASPEPEIAAHLGEALWESGDRESAMSIWQQAFAQDSDSPALNATLEKYGVILTGTNKPSLKLN